MVASGAGQGGRRGAGRRDGLAGRAETPQAGGAEEMTAMRQMTAGRRQALVAAAGAMLGGGLGRPAAAQADAAFPQRAVQMVVAFPPGGQADVVARPLAAALERLWRQPVPVVSRPGASGEIGNASVARAAPDGHTLLVGLSSLPVLPVAARVNGRIPAYTAEQFTPVALITADPTVLVVPAAAPWPDVETFIADARRRPGAIAYSSAGTYSTLHLPMAMLAQIAGVDLLHVPFQGGGPAMTALLGGQVQALASGPGPATAHVREGRLRALATWGARRMEAFPDVPTLEERGFAGSEFYIWAGVFAPAGLPAPVLARLRQGIAAALADAEARRALNASGNTIDHRDGAAFDAFFAADSARLRRVVERLGPIA
jgi:tripartite-type tricarboxylate transporter receptor subunit TctC